MFNNKKGLSEVIATLIIILLVLVAVMVIWVVIRNVINTGSEQINLGKFTVSIELEKVTINPNTIDVVVKRNSGQGDLAGLKFVISDGANSQTIDSSTTLNELEQKTITLSYSGIVKSVGVAPVIKQGTSSAVQEIADTITYSSVDAVNAMPGLVSWWRFEGSANDERGLNNGAVMGATLVSGKYGQAYNFSSGGDAILINDNPSLLLGSNLTFLAWAKPISSQNSHIIAKGDLFTSFPFDLFFDATNKVTFSHNDGTLGIDSSNQVITTSGLQMNNWNQIVGKFNGTSIAIYLNSNVQEVKAKSSTPSPLTGNLAIGNIPLGGTSFKGAIDEVMIFNRSLSDSEIQGIYNLNLDD